MPELRDGARYLRPGGRLPVRPYAGPETPPQQASYPLRRRQLAPDGTIGAWNATANSRLYQAVAARLKEAHTRVRELQVPEGVRMTLSRKLLAITAVAKHDLAGAARRLDRLMEDVDEGRFPEGD